MADAGTRERGRRAQPRLAEQRRRRRRRLHGALSRRPLPPSPQTRAGGSYLTSCPPPRSKCKRAGFFLATHPLPRLKREPEGVSHAVSPPRPKRERAGFSPPILSPHKRERAYSWPPTPSLASNVSQRFYFILLLFVFTILVTHTVVLHILHSLK